MEETITFGGILMPQINFALQQNYVPVLRNVTLHNNTGAALNGVRLRVSFEPEFANDFESGPVTIRPDETVTVSPVNIVLHTDYLFSLTERIAGAVLLEAVQGETVIDRKVMSIELLAYDQWTGVRFMPETCAAFITPNHPAVVNLTAQAGRFLQEWTGDPGFTGYLTHDPNKVRLQMAAIYAALQAENIAYAPAPASYEDAQRIRLPDAVLSGKQGTCLDLAVLYCACLESVGLDPLLVCMKDHAFAACWLENESFPDTLNFDSAALTKRMAPGINTICAVECTMFTAGAGSDFEKACAAAARHLENTNEYEFTIDILRSRSGGIRPIPSRITENGAVKAVDYGERDRREITAAPDEIITGDFIAQGEKREVTKQVIWERRLLDLSLRNSLLNFRPTSMNVQLMTDSLSSLEDEVARGEDFHVCPVPNDMTVQIGDSRIYEMENQRDMISAVAQSEFNSRRLRTYVSEAELEKLMKKLHRLARVSLEENGCNTVYLALGFLKWYESDRSEKARYAPLVLLPIDIIKRTQDKAYSIRARDEETQVNITLLEMLRQFFGIDIQGLSPVPEDESGVNLQLIFNTIRQGVMAKSRWDVLEYAFIGQFSFNRFIMWNDIRNRADELAKNKVVASLISGETGWTAEGIDMTPAELDAIPPTELAVPVSADSSQLAAVYAASMGNSFVLHGPPGSGKSQTITNMIANALYHGKSVLFVAEKMAALSVVEKRLDKIGLGPFCLELHSNKAQKRAVLDQLDETLNVGRIKKPGEYQAEAERLRALREELGGVMAEIHKKRPHGFSLFEAAELWGRNSAQEGKLTLTADQIKRMDGESYKLWKECVGSLANVGERYGDPATSALNSCRITEIGPDTRQRLEELMTGLSAALEEFEPRAVELSRITGLESPTYDQTCFIGKALNEGLGDRDIIKGYLTAENVTCTRDEMLDVTNWGREYTSIKARLEETFNKTLFDLNGPQLLVQWNTAQGKWFLPKAMGTNKLVKQLAAHAKTPSSVTRQNTGEFIKDLTTLQERAEKLDKLPPHITMVLGYLYQGADSDWDRILSAVDATGSMKSALLTGFPEVSVRSTVAQGLENVLGTPELRAANLGRLKAIYAPLDKIITLADELKNKQGVRLDKLLPGNNWIETGIANCGGAVSELPRLKEWTVVTEFVKKLEGWGIGSIGEDYLDGKVSSGELESAFDCALGKAMVDEAVAGSSELRSFQGMKYEDTVRRLSETQDKFRKLTVQELAADLSARIPIPGASAGSSELGFLQKAIKSGGRMMSIRKLFDTIPTLLRRMCPVMLMSPISVAQYIDPAYPKFDLVIFDEASQLPTCEAVGAIARGENVIVVGDPKQMPPTSFFATNTVDEENYEKEDLESVLDDCLALSMPQKHLQWHYRSRHESLIAYSNAKYYDNKLFTFPSPDDQVSEVSWVNVEGSYDKGGSKTNKAEANAIVEEICRRLRDEKLRGQSIGVVTFSLPQQNLVEDTLDAAFRAEPELETIAGDMYEPILIKNLENVQGDERDVIFFSIGYGPDKDGKVSMNFGPLNRDGGWRRLNVAISRARMKMVVYSVLRPEQIDLSRTRSEGVEGLKGFLEFASKGRSALPVRNGSSDIRNGFGEILAGELETLGYKTKCNVGCSDYRIDVAVVNPDAPDTFILGIDCGGERNFRNSTAYDRTVSQPSVLQGLGWNTMSVYLLDWLDNKEQVLAAVRARIEECLGAYRDPKEPETVAQTRKEEPVFEREAPEELADQCQEYVSYKVKAQGRPEDFTEADTTRISRIIGEILKTEAPMSRKSLMTRTFACWGISRPGAVMKRTWEAAMSRVPSKQLGNAGQEFVWLPDQDPRSYDLCRARYKDGEKRSLDEIAPEELGAGVILIMTRQISMTRDDLIRETAHLFGITRVTAGTELPVALGIRAAKLRDKITFGDDGRINVNG